MWKYIFESENKYRGFFIFRFFDMKRDIRLIFERLKRIRIENELNDQKKKLFIEMFYRRKIAMSWNFSEIKQVKPEIYFSVKIRIIFHKI